METSKKETASLIMMLEKVYIILLREEKEKKISPKTISFLANLCIKIYPLFKNNLYFMDLFNYVYQQINNSNSTRLQNLTVNIKGNKLIHLLERFEFSLINQLRFHIYFLNCRATDISITTKNVESIKEIPTADVLSSYTSLLKDSLQNFSVLIYSGQQHLQKSIISDFYIDLKSIIDSKGIITNFEKIDYYTYDKLFLESKLESLKKRQDIRLLLAGSSYTMCGLFEKQMPLPARNIAIDAQDLYYSMKSIRTALNYNPNIKHCILSFAYYFWGYDLSLSTSFYQFKRVTDVNFPIFKDKHNFTGNPKDELTTLLNDITPLKRHLFSFEKVEEDYKENVKELFEDAHYFLYPRVESAVLKNNDLINRQLAQKRADSHNKFFKYHSTVKENIKLFDQFLKEMNDRGINLVLFVPPVTEYYRNFINQEIITYFYECMKPLKSKYQFKLIDLFDSEEFENNDFYDYDHLNDYGAKKLAEILSKELDI